MRYLIDKSPKEVERKSSSELVVGQLLTPLTGNATWGGVFGIDNGAFSGFEVGKFERLLARNVQNRERCLFVTCPDVVGSGRRTMELWRRRERWVRGGWKLAFVGQDGVEEMEIPWEEMDCLFIGGGDPWKDSKASQDLVRTAKILGKHVHVGRVNTPVRYERFAALGADTCDGSGVSRYDWMLERIEKRGERGPTLFDSEAASETMELECKYNSQIDVRFSASKEVEG